MVGDFDLFNLISIHEFAFKCKEWANEHNAVILSWCRGTSGEEDYCYAEVYFAFNYDEDNGDTFELYCGYNEPEAIFKACQWILDNKVK